mgnify:CR=1 FL=1
MVEAWMLLASRRLIRLALLLMMVFGLCIRVSAEAPLVFVIDLEGPINPGTAMYVERGIAAAAEAGAVLAVVRIDTPGGLATSMRSIIKAIVNSRVPVATFVGPGGAGAASAGVMVTVAGHVAAMAPGTNIGAAHPVGAGGQDIDETMSEKVVNDMVAYARGIAEGNGRNGEWVEKAVRESVSITAEEALELNVVDLLADNVPQLLTKIDGRKVGMPQGEVVLRTAGAVLQPFEPGIRDRILKTISDPNIAYLLMMIGLAGLYFELAHPGAIFPGVIGGMSLILAFFAFQTLPVNYAGLMLIALAIILFVIEVKVTSYGLLSIGGLISLTLGSVMLFEDVRVSLRFLMPTVLLVGGFFVVVAGLAFRAYRRKPMGGEEGLIGEVGVVKRAIDPEGLVFVHGEYWNALAPERIEAGEKVEVEKVEGLTLRVKRCAS